MGRLTVSILLLVSAAWALPVSAADTASLSEEDCRKITEGAVAPKAVPADVAEQCRNILALAAPGAGSSGADSDALSADAAAADPCVGAGAGSSVYCWGPWTLLAPSAAAPVTANYIEPISFDNRDLYSASAEGGDDPDGPIIPPIPPEPVPPVLPLGGCAAGESCGFATVGAINAGVPDADPSEVAVFDMSSDGASYSVRAGEPNEIQSVDGMTTIFSDRNDGYENMRAIGIDDPINPTLVSETLARALRINGDVAQAADFWAAADPNSGDGSRGFFAWGSAASQEDLDALNAMGGTTLGFSGAMSNDNTTVANITLNFGPEASWRGNWTNPNYSFNAGGGIEGANFGSDPSQFSRNVRDGYVQGALVGPAENRGVAHVINVDLAGPGAVRDVGLLRQN